MTNKIYYRICMRQSRFKTREKWYLTRCHLLDKAIFSLFIVFKSRRFSEVFPPPSSGFWKCQWREYKVSLPLLSPLFSVSWGWEYLWVFIIRRIFSAMMENYHEEKSQKRELTWHFVLPSLTSGLPHYKSSPSPETNSNLKIYYNLKI